jgi:hypothetical protein
MDELEEIVTKMAAFYRRKTSPEMIAAFRRAVAGLDIDLVRSAAERWVQDNPRIATPGGFRDSCKARRAPGASTASIVCQDCGEKIDAKQIDRHADVRDGWCEAVVRRRCGDPPIDRYLVHLRGLANALGTKEARQNLDDYLASRVPAKTGSLLETF